jgi:hypothetical protein
MRSIAWLAGLGAVLASGCTISTMAAERRGTTEREYRGTVPLVFTNATPDRMCGLYMSFENVDAYGDNWLPPSGLAPGKSAEFKIRPGKYKARWDTCMPPVKAQPYYAATLYREAGFKVLEPTQLYAYVASAMAPTQLATPRWDLKMVRFQGQPIDQDPAAYRKRFAARPSSPSAPAAPQVTVYLCRFCVSGTPSGVETPFTEPVVEVAPVDMSEFVEKKAIAGKPAVKPGKPGDKPVKPEQPVGPSLRRGHDVAEARANYAPR